MSKLKVVVLAGVSMVALLFPAADGFAATGPAPMPTCPPGQHHSGATCVKNTPPKPVRRTPTCAKGFHRSIFPPHKCVRNRTKPKPKRRTPTCAKGFHRSAIPPHRCVRNRPGPKPTPSPTR